MENDNAQTLEALETYIQSQRALLSRTQSDIGRLRQLRGDAVADPQSFFDTIDEKLLDSAFHLSGDSNVAFEIQQKIDWSLFKGQDISGLRIFANELRAKQHERTQPSDTQRSPLSPLQILVRDARRTILDPVLMTIIISSDSSEGEDELTPEESRKERERAKIRELRKRRIGEGGLTLPHGRTNGVYVRKDLADESGLVDISLDDGGTQEAISKRSTGTVHAVATPSMSTPSPTTVSRSLPVASTRSRRAAPKHQSAGTVPVTKTHVKSGASGVGTKVKRPPEPDSEPEQQPSGKRAKPRPETYKQAWSVSEQHLLERLMGEIPDGEKNRWAKISKAMNGRRTPRQVASRVQKYFEKLKRFGVDIGTGSGAFSAIEKDTS